MINSLLIKDLGNTPVSYINNGEWDPVYKQIEFKKGVNIIIGGNGCGKTTILEILRYYFLLPKTQYKSSFVCTNYKNSICNDINLRGKYATGVEVKADYDRSVFNLVNQIEANSGHDTMNSITSFSDFYFSTANSSGQTKKNNYNTLFELMFNGEKHRFRSELKPVEFYLGDEISKDMNNYYTDNHIPSKTFTILMDEPDVNLDINGLDMLYNILSYDRDDTQILVVIHNPILIYKLSKLSSINFIEIEKGYLSKIKSFVK